MATGPAPHHSITVAGLDVDTAATILLAQLDGRRDLTAHRIDDGRILLTRTRRPRAALRAGIATIWIGGLGLLLLLIRRTEAAEIGLRDSPRGTTITLPPLLDAPERAELTAALQPDTQGPNPAGPDTSGSGRARGADDEAPTSAPTGDLDAPTIPR